MPGGGLRGGARDAVYHCAVEHIREACLVDVESIESGGCRVVGVKVGILSQGRMFVSECVGQVWKVSGPGGVRYCWNILDPTIHLRDGGEVEITSPNTVSVLRCSRSSPPSCTASGPRYKVCNIPS